MQSHSPTINKTLESYPLCRHLLGEQQWARLIPIIGEEASPEALTKGLALLPDGACLPLYLPDLARLEHALALVDNGKITIPQEVAGFTPNPTLQLLELSWKGLGSMVAAWREDPDQPLPLPCPGQEWVCVYRGPLSDKVWIRPSAAEDLLALKTVAENHPLRVLAEEAQAPVGLFDQALKKAKERGLILSPPSRLHRLVPVSTGQQQKNVRQTIPVFTLQWHVTHACDLHCKHCYDRSKRTAPSLAQCLLILDGFFDFCQDRHVQGQVTFSGGNPLLYPHFTEVYRAAAERGMALAVLGNPVGPERLRELLAIQRPEFFQVSLEGLKAHNDTIRGKGHFARVLSFLKILKDCGIFSMVMLTLTRDNLDQVLPLAELLRDRADLFTFNRLALVGEGANLNPVDPQEYPAFLERYMEAAAGNPVIRLKDNLFNIIRYRQAREPIPGCAGFGCAAAFSFLSLLPDGEVHACRKFPSLLGSIYEQSLGEIYDSAIAKRYRQGPEACRLCPVSPKCRGCPAVMHGFGLDVFRDRDPYCFFS